MVMNMDRYVLVDPKGIVENVMMWDGDEENWAPPEGCTPILSDIAGIGWTYSNGAFSGPSASTSPQISTTENNSAIKAQLAELDGKSIRALHEAVLALAASGAALPADTTKLLQDLETQKQELRAKLV